MARRRLRRGANALEFALTAPIIVVMLAGITDYGWLFHQQIALQNAARNGVRAGSVTPEGEDALRVASDETEAVLSNSGVDPDQVKVKVSFEAAYPDERIRVTATMPYEPLIGLVPVPDVLDSSLAMRLENQEEP